MTTGWLEKGLHWGLPLVVVLFGLTAAAAPRLTPARDAAQVAVFLVPWQSDGFSRLVDAGLPILGLRLGGRLVVLATGGDPLAADALRDNGLIVVAATAPPGCLDDLLREPA